MGNESPDTDGRQCRECGAELGSYERFCSECSAENPFDATGAGETIGAGESDSAASTGGSEPADGDEWGTGQSEAETEQPGQSVDAGHSQSQSRGQPVTDEKSPGLALVLSFLVTGAGQLYNGEIGKGIGLFFLQVLNVFLAFLFIGVLLIPLVWIYGMYDAYTQAKKTNRQPVDQQASG